MRASQLIRVFDGPLQAQTVTDDGRNDTKTMAFDEVVPNAPIEPGTFAIER